MTSIHSVLPALDPSAAHVFVPESGKWLIYTVDEPIIDLPDYPSGVIAVDTLLERATQRIDATLYLSHRGQVPDSVRQLAARLLAGIWLAAGAVGVTDDMWRACGGHLSTTCLDMATLIAARASRGAEQ